MIPPREANLAMLAIVAERLGDLREQVAFLGGCTLALFLSDEGSSLIRPTYDVDLIVEVTSSLEFRRLEESLRQRGFRQELDEDVICRWTVADVKVDIMPTDEAILGFSNTWYKYALQQASNYQLTDALQIRLVSAPCLAATKIVAFHNRGNGDYLASHDMEDLVTLIDGRPELIAEIANEDADLRTFLAHEISGFLARGSFRQALPGHLPPDPASQQRLALLLDRCGQIAEMK